MNSYKEYREAYILFLTNKRQNLKKILTILKIGIIITNVSSRNADVAELADAQDLKSCGT